VFALALSARKDNPNRFLIGSFLEDFKNKIRVVEYFPDSKAFHSTNEFEHPYPPTRLMFVPDVSGTHPDLFASTGDYLRLWEIKNGSVQSRGSLSNSKNQESCSPLTSFDWNPYDLSIIGTASIDTTCTIWDIQAQKLKTQLIAHDQEVFDIAFGRCKDTFASVSADGSMRLFDLRALEHSTIIFETPNTVPLLRLSWCRQDPNYLATFSVGSGSVYIIDIRKPSIAVATLKSHTSCVNDITWSPHSSTQLLSAGEDKSALIWDLTQTSNGFPTHPVLHFEASNPVSAVKWSPAKKEWVAAASSNQCLILKV